MQPGLQRFVMLFPLAMVFMMLGAGSLTVLCTALLVAQFWLAGERRKAAGTAALAGACGLLMLGSIPAALLFAGAAAAGIPIALMSEQGWSFGRRLALLAGATYAPVAGFILANWQEVRRDVTVFINARIAEMAASDVSNEQVAELGKWLDVNCSYLCLGSVFGSVLMLSAILLSQLDRWQLSPDALAKRKPSGFQRMKVPDWVVWIAIAVALLWFADYRWPNELLRTVTWNAALGLAFVYWLNGLSILLYALSVFKATAFATFMVFSGLFLFNSLLPVLGVFGLFDTWYDFRLRLRRIAIMRRLGYRTGGRDS